MESEQRERATQSSRSRKRTFHCNGREYSFADIAELHGITYEAAYRRWRLGWTDREMVEGIRAVRKEARLRRQLQRKNLPQRRQTTVQVGGQTYASLRQAYDALRPKISFAAVRTRIRTGDSLEEALDVTARFDGRRRPKAAKKMQVTKVSLAISYGGVNYPNISRLARAHGVPVHIIRGRLEQGWTVERAISERRQDRSVTVRGITYRSADDAWKRIGKVSHAAFRGRRSKGLSLEVSLGLEPLPIRVRYRVDGNNYQTLADVADAYNIPLTTVEQRVRSMSLERALSYVPRMGRYSAALFRRDAALAEKPAFLYFTSVELAGGPLHKVGITVLSVSRRLAAVDHRILALYRGPLSKIYEMEQRALRRFRGSLSKANRGFDGKTETLRLSDRQTRHVLEYLKIAARRCECEKVDGRGVRRRPRS